MSRTQKWILLWLAATLMAPGAVSSHDPPRLQALQISEGVITVDGHLDDDAWADAAIGTDFVQHSPHSGEPASERTEVRVLYSTVALYVGVRAFDSQPDGIHGRLARRDRRSTSDEIAIFFDSYHDRRTAFEFAINPAGSIRDVYRFNDSPWMQDASWDAVWQVATSIDSLGWTAEFRIPLTQLRFDNRNSTWGFQVCRVLLREAEEACWSSYPQDATRFVSHFGMLEGLEGLSQPMRLELQPYTAISSHSQQPQAAGLYVPGHSAELGLGLDAQYGLTSDLTLDLTINPDFGQVQADPANINLTAFETFFPEQRPFFVEGSGFFQYWTPIGQPFYSRRIGRRPQGFAAPPPGGSVELPDRTAIVGAAKVTGKTAGGLGVGALSALTRAEYAQLRNADEAVIERHLVEPLTHHAAVRVEQDFQGGDHTVGAFITAVNRSLRDEVSFLHSEAYSLLIDGSHRFARRSYSVQWQIVGTRVAGSEEALLRTQRSSLHYFQRPDAAHLSVNPDRTSLSGLGLTIGGRRLTGRWQYGATYNYVAPGMNINDAGFQWGGADRQIGNAWIDYVQSTPMWILNNFRIGAAASRTATTGSELMSTWFRPIVFIGTFRNNWSLQLNPLALQPQRRLVTALRGGPSLRGDLWRQSWLGLNTDQRKRVSGRLWASVGGLDIPDAQWYDIDLSVTVRPTDATGITLSSAYARRSDPRQWVTRREALGEDRYILATLSQRTLDFRARGEWILSPTLSIELYAQPFVSSGAYSDFKEVADPQAPDFGDRFRTYGDELTCRDDSICEVDLNANGQADLSFARPDFSFAQLRSTLVARWEFRPGSVVYLAWQHGRNSHVPDGRFGGLHGMTDLLTQPAANTVLLKVNYWLGL